MAPMFLPTVSVFLLLLVVVQQSLLVLASPKPLFGIGIGRTQSAGVEGTLLCEGKPMADVLVKLYDDDRGVDTDDLMAEGKTDSKGRFSLEGYTHEFTTIDPKINIYHDCNDLLPCQRKISIMIPDKYISSGKTPERYYNAGEVELEGKFKGEERDCLH
uniref:Transthyretin-like protein 1 n=1 Tax=Radopholus similis TaxID=46012 RepID=A4Q9L1_RADSI|nr:transthyretin-like protein 1 precursor [Radopholus similis]